MREAVSARLQNEKQPINRSHFQAESVKEGTYGNDKEIAIYDGEDGLTYIEKRGTGYYGHNDEFDFEAKDRAELEYKLKSWKYRLISGSINEAYNPQNTKVDAFEGVMSDVDIIAQESATFDEFVNSIKVDPDYKSIDVNDAEVKAFLQQMYDDAQGMNEVSGFASGKQFISIKLQKYPKALAKVNELITMIGESKFTMEMAEWLFDFFNNASFERPVSESKRVEKTSIKETIRGAIRTQKS